jgi:hypothetical protein
MEHARLTVVLLGRLLGRLLGLLLGAALLLLLLLGSQLHLPNAASQLWSEEELWPHTPTQASCPYCHIIEAPWLVNGGHGASLRHHYAHADTG